MKLDLLLIRIRTESKSSSKFILNNYIRRGTLQYFQISSDDNSRSCKVLRFSASIILSVISFNYVFHDNVA